MHVDIVVNVFAGYVDWKHHGKGTAKNETHPQAQQEQQNQQRTINSMGIRESIEGINMT